MGLAHRHLNTHQEAVRFDPAALGARLEENLPEAVFCLLMGSASEGLVAPGSDLDLAFYLSGSRSLEFYLKVQEAAEAVVPGVRCDVGVLNGCEPVYRFEALKGRLIFCRDPETYQGFFSLTCREYESQMASYARQHRYRMEALSGR